MLSLLKASGGRRCTNHTNVPEWQLWALPALWRGPTVLLSASTALLTSSRVDQRPPIRRYARVLWRRILMTVLLITHNSTCSEIASAGIA